MRGGLTAAEDASLRGATALLERVLNAPDRAPAVVAVSGGGDSMALLHVAAAWAERAGRPLIVLSVDHGLQPASGDWCGFVADRAAALGLTSRTLVWPGEKPRTGLPAAARRARHALIAEAARQAGARVVLMAHTADDLLEGLAMRAAGCSAPLPRPWSPSPAWPEGRGIFVLRPLLGVRRAALRAFLDERGERWIDDPANGDVRFARAAARVTVSACEAASPPFSDDARHVQGVAEVVEGAAGDLSAPRAAILMAEGGRLLGAMLLCAAGGGRPPRGRSLKRLLGRLKTGEDFVATLAGARIEARGDAVTCCRDAGERGALAQITPQVGETVFDGRFVVTATEPGWRVRGLRGVMKRIPRAQRTRLAQLPPVARAALPAAISPAGDVCCPILQPFGPVSARPLGLNRLRATLGCIPDEASLWRVAQTPSGA